MRAPALSDSILADLVEKSFITNLQQHSRLFAVPIGFFESAGNGFRFGFILGIAGQ